MAWEELQSCRERCGTTQNSGARIVRRREGRRGTGGCRSSQPLQPRTRPRGFVQQHKTAVACLLFSLYDIICVRSKTKAKEKRSKGAQIMSCYWRSMLLAKHYRQQQQQQGKENTHTHDTTNTSTYGTTTTCKTIMPGGAMRTDGPDRVHFLS